MEPGFASNNSGPGLGLRRRWLKSPSVAAGNGTIARVRRPGSMTEGGKGGTEIFVREIDVRTMAVIEGEAATAKGLDSQSCYREVRYVADGGT
ncbi:hypothetical protein U1Q18_017107 [Sarracenia purpurea var. burkii]